MSAILKAVLSHYIAKKDQIMAELDICLNKPVDNSVDKAIKLFGELTFVEHAIDTVNTNINFNNNRSVKEVSNLIESIGQAIPPPPAPADRKIEEGKQPSKAKKR